MLGCLRALGAALRERGSGLVVRARAARSARSPRSRREMRRGGRVLDERRVAVRPRRDRRVTTRWARPASRRGRTAAATASTSAGRARGPASRSASSRRSARAWPTPSGATSAARRAHAGAAVRACGAAGCRRSTALGLGSDVARAGLRAGRGRRRARRSTRFLAGPVDDYARRNDEPAGGTSVLSPYLRWGCLSARECEERAARARRPRGAGMGAAAVLARLLRAPAAAPPRAARATSSRSATAARSSGRRTRRRLEAWQEGRTGFPLVDAGMRQLRETGWMHNRVRLVVGSFLTKDLHLDWRAGEAWFARLLLDGEPAQNTGNWQWIASVGADPAPVLPADVQPRPPPGALRPRRRVRAPLGAGAARRPGRAPRRAVDDERRASSRRPAA